VASKFTPGTLPDHERCSTHLWHALGCEQYERLLARSGQRCEICGLPGAENPRRKLFIDHSALNRWAVRGLLCNRCNTRLTVEAEIAALDWCADYLADSWWIQECKRVGVPAAIAPEPDCGSVIRDQFDVVWLREGDGKWRPRGTGRPGISSASWQWLYNQRGPQNMAVLDLYGSDDNAGLRWESERAMLRAILAESYPSLGYPNSRGVLDRLIAEMAALWPGSGASSRNCARR
jgi:hypothetical protein